MQYGSSKGSHKASVGSPVKAPRSARSDQEAVRAWDAQKLSHQLRSAEDRIAELEAEVTAYRDRAERAEQWLHRVYSEIEERFLRHGDAPHGVARSGGTLTKAQPDLLRLGLSFDTVTGTSSAQNLTKIRCRLLAHRVVSLPRSIR
jgi:hypothetical protein